jgi:hypothetical protein
MSIVIQHHQLVDHPFLLAIVLLINTWDITKSA